MKNDRENPWDKIPRPSHGFDYVLVDNTHPLKLMWGISFNGDFLFCYEAPEIQMPNLNSFPELKGIKFNIIDHNSNKILILQLKDSKEWEIFKFLCTDLVRYTSSLDENDDIAELKGAGSPNPAPPSRPAPATMVNADKPDPQAIRLILH